MTASVNGWMGDAVPHSASGMPAPVRCQPPIFNDERNSLPRVRPGPTELGGPAGVMEGTTGVPRQVHNNSFEADLRDEPAMVAACEPSVSGPSRVGAMGGSACQAVSTSPKIRYGKQVINQVNEFRHNGHRKHTARAPPRSLDALENSHQVGGVCKDLVCVDNLKILRHLLNEDTRQVLAGHTVHMQELLKELREDLKGDLRQRAGGQQRSESPEFQNLRTDFLNISSELRSSVIQEIRKVAKAQETSTFLSEEFSRQMEHQVKDKEYQAQRATPVHAKDMDAAAAGDFMSASESSKFAELSEELKVLRNMMLEGQGKLKKTVEDRTKEHAAQLAKELDSLERHGQNRWQNLAKELEASRAMASKEKEDLMAAMAANNAKWTDTFVPAMLALRSDTDALHHTLEEAHRRIEAVRGEIETSRSDLASLHAVTLEGHINLQNKLESQLESQLATLGENSKSSAEAHSRSLEQLAKEAFKDREEEKTDLKELKAASKDLNATISSNWTNIFLPEIATLRGELEALRTRALRDTLEAVQEGQNRLKNIIEARTQVLDENATTHATVHAKALEQLASSSHDRWQESVKERHDMQAQASKDREDLMAANSSKWTELFLPEMGFFRKELEALLATMQESQIAMNDTMDKKTHVLSETITCHAKEHAQALDSLSHNSDDRWRELANENEATKAKAIKQKEELIAASDAKWNDVFVPEILALRARILDGQAELKNIVSPPSLVPGMLRVIVKSARNLTNMDSGFFGNVSDPYVQVQVGNQEVRTPVIDNNLNPVWQDHNSFELAVQSEVKLVFVVKNKNKKVEDNLLGLTTLDFRFLTPNLTYEKNEPLINGQAGELSYSVCFTPDG